MRTILREIKPTQEIITIKNKKKQMSEHNRTSQTSKKISTLSFLYMEREKQRKTITKSSYPSMSPTPLSFLRSNSTTDSLMKVSG